MPSVIVTGGSGKAGTAAIRELLAHGYAVLNVDVAPPAERLCHFVRTDLRDMGQTVDALRHAAGSIVRPRAPIGIPDAVLHLAGVPAPGLTPDGVALETNVISTYNVFSAATLLGLPRVVWASSETVYGVPFTRTPPSSAPITEDHARAPENGYALSKLLCEDMAEQIQRWNPATRFIGLRISNIFDEAEYDQFPGFWADGSLRRFNLWSWVDSRDVGRACRLALEAEASAGAVYTIAAADTLMTQTSRSLMAAYFPGVLVTETLELHESLLSIDKAKRELGYQPQHSWRDRHPGLSAGC